MTFFAAANDFIECLFQFGMVGFFLLMSLGGWVIKQMSATAQKRAAKQRLAEQEMQPWQNADSQSGSQGNRPQKPKANPYESYLRGEIETSDVMEAEVIEATEEHHLTSTLSSDHLAEHASQLGKIDPQLEGSIHDLFDYEVGLLGDSSDAIHEDPNADKLPEIAVTTTEIADIFRSPERIREALIMNEILMRPDDRLDRDW